jgi:hypothetical protein
MNVLSVPNQRVMFVRCVDFQFHLVSDLSFQLESNIAKCRCPALTISTTCRAQSTNVKTFTRRTLNMAPDEVAHHLVRSK